MLLNILIEQNSFAFTGRVNILDNKSGQIQGRLILKEGEVLFAQYKHSNGVKALFNACIDSTAQINFVRFVIEPELIDSTAINIPFNFPILLKKIKDELASFQSYKELKPSHRLKVYIRPSFIGDGEKLDLQEFQLLTTIIDFNLVKDIYERSELMDYQITKGLVSLRKKNALVIV